MPKASTPGPGWLSTRQSLLLVASSVLLPVLVINPFREMLSQDDSWAYARMVQHLLQTGRYQLDAWAAANMPVQIYLAAAASRLFGYSLSTLRITTLCLMAIAVVALYLLIREMGRDRVNAVLTACALVASPLVLLLGFTFMSDIHFLGWMLLALWLYARGISRSSVSATLLASLAAGCAIGTRQFGIAILVGFVAAWLLCPTNNRFPPRLLIAGVVGPLLAAAAQLYIGLRSPNFTQAYRIFELHDFLGRPSPALMAEGAWRIAVILQYCGISLIPLLPILLWPKPGRAARQYAVIFITCTAIVLMLIAGSPLTARPEAQHHHRLWEPLELYWLLPTQFQTLPWAMRMLDAGGIVGAGCAVWTAMDSFRRDQLRKPATVLLAGTGLTLAALHLAYVQLNDTYITALVPFILIVASLRIGPELPSALRTASLSLCFLFILGISLWMRGEYSAQQAAWQSSETLYRRGVPSQDIQAPLHWAEYHGAFDSWIAAGAPGFNPSESSFHGNDALHGPFYRWLDARSAQPVYELRDSRASYDATAWQPIRTVTYRNVLLSKRELLTLRHR